MQVNITAKQVTIYELPELKVPMIHLTECKTNGCPLQEGICCFECEAECVDRCYDLACRNKKVKARLNIND